jgi:hypothetical protein
MQILIPEEDDGGRSQYQVMHQIIEDDLLRFVVEEPRDFVSGCVLFLQAFSAFSTAKFPSALWPPRAARAALT